MDLQQNKTEYILSLKDCSNISILTTGTIYLTHFTSVDWLLMDKKEQTEF